VLDKDEKAAYTVIIEYRISKKTEREPELRAMTPGVDSSSSPTIQFGLVQEAVVDRIRDMIVKGQLQPGDRLRQDELAETFGVSTMPIREALRQLQAEGLVSFQPRRGAAVASLSVSEYEEIYRIREELEILACGWAAEDFDRIPIENLRELLAEIREAEAHPEDIYPRLQLVREFFFTVFEASRKEHLLRMLSSLWDMSQQYRRYFSSVPEIVPQRLNNYHSVLRACEARDPQELIEAIRTIHDFGRSTRVELVREQEGKRPLA
jgi:DNA-binding GntR family transcriptional regulator